MLKFLIADRCPGGSAARSCAADDVRYGGSGRRSCVYVEGMKMDDFQDVIQETTVEHLCAAERF